MVLACPARRDGHASELDINTGGSLLDEVQAVVEVARTVASGMIERPLRACENNGLCARIKNGKRHGGFFHGIRAMGDEDAVDVGAGELHVDGAEQLIEIRQGDGAGVELAEFDDFNVCRKATGQFLAGDCWNERAVRGRGAGDGAAGGDKRDSHGLHPSD